MEYAAHMEETGNMTHNYIGRAAALVGSVSAPFLRPAVAPSSGNEQDGDNSANEPLVCRVPVSLSTNAASLFDKT